MTTSEIEVHTNEIRLHEFYEDPWAPIQGECHFWKMAAILSLNKKQIAISRKLFDRFCSYSVRWEKIIGQSNFIKDFGFGGHFWLTWWAHGITHSSIVVVRPSSVRQQPPGQI